MLRPKITNKATGIYFNEIDLTVAQQAAGSFAGGSICLAQKGPAFEIVSSANQEERELRLGGLNPNFPASYHAYSFLEEASNMKEVRMLGLEGYTDTEGYAILLDVSGNRPKITGTQTAFTITGATQANPVVVTTSAPHGYLLGDRIKISSVVGMTEINGTFLVTPGVSATTFSLTGINGTAFTAYVSGGTATRIETPSVSTTETVMAILKNRLTTFTGMEAIESVVISGYGLDAANDDLFTLTINFPIADPISVVCSLRPSRKEYITKLFGTDPRDGTLLFGNPSPLWVEFVMPSVTSKLEANGANNLYYLPGETNPANSYTELPVLEGNIGIDTAFQYGALTVTGATNASPIVLTVGSHYLIEDDVIQVTGVLGNTAANGTWMVKNLTATTVELYDSATGLIASTGNAAYTSGGVGRLQYVATWESEVLSFDTITYQTPTTPWFVSDVDLNGQVRRLFRFWSISDGEAANTEIKIEISNIDPTAKGGKGQFDVYVRVFTDRDDLTKSVVDGFPRVTLDPTDDDYILKRIGDGEEYQFRSTWIFVELTDENGGIIEEGSLPYGVEGYANSDGLVFPEVVWTTEYDADKPIRRQMLGLANNQVNMFKELAPDQLTFRNVSNSATSRSKGFHLNEDAPLTDFNVVDATNFVLNPAENKLRLKYVVGFSGGFDGWNVYSARTWNDTLSKDFESLTTAIAQFEDAESLISDVSVLVTPDLNIDEHANACESVLDMVISRQDCLYIPDFVYDSEALPSTVVNSIKFSNMNSSFVAIYHPYVQYADKVNKKNIWVAPSLTALATIARVAGTEDVWQPPANSLRTVSTNILRTRRRMKAQDREDLKEVNINPITDFPGTGLEIAESRTTQEDFSALSFIHNRLLLGYIKKSLRQVLRPLLQQLNNSITSNQFTNAVFPILDKIKKKGGIEDFLVEVNNKSDDRVTLYGTVTIYPYYPVERIVLDFVLKNQELSVTQA